jgi:hypothetical protein
MVISKKVWHYFTELFKQRQLLGTCHTALTCCAPFVAAILFVEG